MGFGGGGGEAISFLKDGWAAGAWVLGTNAISWIGCEQKMEGEKVQVDVVVVVCF